MSDRYYVLSSFSVPCEPLSLAVDIYCKTNSAILSWNESEGAVKYFVFAQPMDGDMLYCDSTNTSCIIEGLECGEMYNFSVEASNGICNSSFSAPLQAGAGKYQSPKVNYGSSKNIKIKYRDFFLRVVIQLHHFTENLLEVQESVVCQTQSVDTFVVSLRMLR